MSGSNPESVTLPEGWDELEWTVFRHRDRWPSVPALVFIAEAVDRLSDAIWANEDVDLERVRARIDPDPSDQWRVGILWSMVNLFEPLLTTGTLTVHVSPISDGGTRPLRGHVWTRDLVAHAVSEGKIPVCGPDGSAEHWLFLDGAEFDLLMLLHSSAGAAPAEQYRNLQARHDAMAEVILENLSAIAASQRLTLARREGAALARRTSAADPTPWELDAMFADAPRVLERRHQLALIDRVAAWYVARFLADPHELEHRDPLRAEAKAKFAPYLSNDLNKDAWMSATREFERRTRKGRR